MESPLLPAADESRDWRLLERGELPADDARLPPGSLLEEPRRDFDLDDDGLRVRLGMDDLLRMCAANAAGNTAAMHMPSARDDPAFVKPFRVRED